LLRTLQPSRIQPTMPDTDPVHQNGGPFSMNTNPFPGYATPDCLTGVGRRTQRPGGESRQSITKTNALRQRLIRVIIIPTLLHFPLLARLLINVDTFFLIVVMRRVIAPGIAWPSWKENDQWERPPGDDIPQIVDLINDESIAF
jgi:hypothetical protein